jgi:ubiquinone/menaquinone biosynthesis C-methylase UbiE
MKPSQDETKVAALWDQNADLWTRQVRAGQDRFREVYNNPMFMEFLPNLSGLQVLDVGCGEGHNTRLFARSGACMTAVDISPRLIQAAQEEENRQPLGIHYSLCSFANLSGFADENFDVVVSTMAIMDGPNFDLVARAAYRVLKQKGGLYFSVTHPCFMTRSSRYVKDAAGEEAGWLVSNYWNEEPYVERWGFGAGADQAEDAFTIQCFPYRLEDYVNGLCDAGFIISRIKEPRPTEAMVSIHPRLAPFRRHIPHTLYIAATK